ncbi:MAG: hypothetical protein A2776_00545 [Candidatus Levybacteria bacterium RIFCSPHIGHO2_01_FULL_40_10]|nr:MAG: hypothetical protein A2776_00545 [Candidatus Levybacteria bacterium RIFCSPHIGHO2_01_FULL_40_10]
MVMFEQEKTAFFDMMNQQERVAPPKPARGLSPEERRAHLKTQRAEQRERTRNRNSFLREANALLEEYPEVLPPRDLNSDTIETTTLPLYFLGGGNVAVRIVKTVVESDEEPNALFHAKITETKIESYNLTKKQFGTIFSVRESVSRHRVTAQDPWRAGFKDTELSDKFGQPASNDYVATAAKAVNYMRTQFASQWPRS